MNPINPEETRNISSIPPFVLGLADWCLLNLAFFSLNYWKRGSLELSPIYVKLLLGFYGIWFIVSLFNKKFQLRQYAGLGGGLWTLARNGLYLAYCVAIMVVLSGWYQYSRTQVFGACLVLVGFEWIAFGGIYFFSRKFRAARAKWGSLSITKPSRISWWLVSTDFILVGVSFFIVNYLKRDGLHILPDYEKLLLIMYGLWFVCSLSTRKFERRDYLNFYHGLWPWVKAVALMSFSLGLIVFLFRFTYFSRIQVFGPMAVLLVFEAVFYRIYYERRKKSGTYGDIESVSEMAGLLKQEPLNAQPDLESLKEAFLSPIRERLRDRYLKNDPGLFALMDQCMDLEGILRAETAIRNSSEMLYSDTLGAQYMRLFINLRKLNDVRYLNRYFLAAHNLLVVGGYLVCRVHTIRTHRNWMLRKFPRIFANALYAVDSQASMDQAGLFFHHQGEEPNIKPGGIARPPLFLRV